MWVADYLDYRRGEWKPLMNQLSGWRSYEPTEKMMLEKCEVFLKLKTFGQMSRFRIFEMEWEAIKNGRNIHD